MSVYLAANGHHVVGLARDASDSTFPGTLVSVHLTDSDATQATLDKHTKSQTFDGVVNNVGLVRPQRLESVDLKDLDEGFALNVHPALLTTQAVLPAMRESRHGRIVNLSSLAVLGAIERTAYAAAKAALISFSRSWAMELAPTGISVNARSARADGNRVV